MTAEVEGSPVLAFLCRAAREFEQGGWIFTGFHWPVLAAALARRLSGVPFVQVFEAGAACNTTLPVLPTSTTDYQAYAGAICYRGNTSDVVLSMGRRFHRVLLDAGTVDVRGSVNSTAIGDYRRPSVRLPGGGGAPDVAAEAVDLVLLHAGADPKRIQARAEHVTSRAASRASIRLITRWGVVRLGRHPALLERIHAPGAEEFEEWLRELNVALDGSPEPMRMDELSLTTAAEIVREAAARGYRAARAALTTG